MLFHVRATLRDDPGRDEVRLDLTEAELRQLVDRYATGAGFLIGGRFVDATQVARLLVTVTGQSSAELRAAVQLERARRRPPSSRSEDWDIAATGTDVTDRYLQAPSTVAAAAPNVPDPRSVFVVHGRNLKARDAMYTFLTAINLQPLEFELAALATRQPNPFIGDVLTTAFGQAQAFLVLLTPDDEARLQERFRKAGDPDFEAQLTGQARPNVLFEAGMAMSRDEKRTAIVQLGQMRPFSDIFGRLVLSLNNSVAARQRLADRLGLAGCAVVVKGEHWHTAGDFEAAL
jgi:predicted nucleotide-binding protein